jgi:hypothetical protein
MAADVLQRLATLQQSMPELHLYGLVDGLKYQEHHGAPLTTQRGLRALFDGTPDAALAHAGPWLVDAELAKASLVATLGQLEQDDHAVTWLIAPQNLEGLTQLLQLRLNTHLPDGRTALVRFWDPRVLVNLVEIMTAGQRAEFFAHIHEWHLLLDGQRTWIGRHHADAQ